MTGKKTDTSTATDTAELDFDAWLGRATRPEREVVLFAGNVIQADIDRLEQELQVLSERGAETGGGWAGDVTDARVAEINTELAEHRAALAATGMTFRVRCPDADTIDEIDRRHPYPKGADDDQVRDVNVARTVEYIAAQIVAPKVLTVEQVKALRNAVGDPEFMKLTQKCDELRTMLAASSPFWRGTSGNTRS